MSSTFSVLPLINHSSVIANGTIRRAVLKWGRQWNTPGLAQGLSVEYSERLKRSLGRCFPSRARILLHSSLRSTSRKRLLEVLCHEVAHVATYQLHGRDVRPHGLEWSALVTAAGFSARARANCDVVLPPRRSQSRRPLTVEHLCPVCLSRRLARRAVPQWRCAECIAAGLDGELLITRFEAAK